jgi:hypothetical protein
MLARNEDMGVPLCLCNWHGAALLDIVNVHLVRMSFLRGQR